MIVVLYMHLDAKGSAAFQSAVRIAFLGDNGVPLLLAFYWCITFKRARKVCCRLLLLSYFKKIKNEERSL